MFSNKNVSTSQRPMSGPVPEGMSACKICGRHFNTDRIDKHEVICKKTSTKKRKIFDVTKHRVQVSSSFEIIYFHCSDHKNKLFDYPFSTGNRS